jgi:endonuclease/exonuclease/phosphatase family metal-dependent hydrolase
MQPREQGRRPLRHTPLRIATYNVHGCLGTDGRVAPRRVARVLEQFDADIIALQELDAGRARSRSEDQLSIIAQELGLQACFCVSVEHQGERYGHALLARVPMKVMRRDRLPGVPGRPREPRAAMWVTVEWLGRTLHVIGTHLGLGKDERWNQINALLEPEWLGGLNGQDPVVLCGDLNLHPGSRGYRRIATRMRDVQAHAPRHVACRTFPALFPVRCLDYIFVSTHFTVHAARVPRDALTIMTSDHLPLVSDLDVLS